MALHTTKMTKSIYFIRIDSSIHNSFQKYLDEQNIDSTLISSDTANGKNTALYQMHMDTETALMLGLAFPLQSSTSFNL